MVFLKKKKWFVCTNIVSIKWNRCEAWFFFFFSLCCGPNLLTVWTLNGRPLLEGAKSKSARQPEKEVFKSAVKWSQCLHWGKQHHLLYCDVCPVSIWSKYLTNCEIRWCPPSWCGRAGGCAHQITYWHKCLSGELSPVVVPHSLKYLSLYRNLRHSTSCS